MTFETYINVESYSNMKSIKYIRKYVNKGSDQATFALQNTDRDEVDKFQSISRMRHSFVIMLVFCRFSNSAELWEKYRHHLEIFYMT